MHRAGTKLFQRSWNNFGPARVSVPGIPAYFAPCRQPHPRCDAPPQPDDDAYNLLDTTSTNLEEGDELHYACKNDSYAIESSNPNLASDGKSFVLGRKPSMLNK